MSSSRSFLTLFLLALVGCEEPRINNRQFTPEFAESAALGKPASRAKAEATAAPSSEMLGAASRASAVATLVGLQPGIDTTAAGPPGISYHRAVLRHLYVIGGFIAWIVLRWLIRVILRNRTQLVALANTSIVARGGPRTGQ